MIKKDPLYQTNIDEHPIKDEILPYEDRMSICSEKVAEQDSKKILMKSLEIVNQYLENDESKKLTLNKNNK